jgi:hypothetical protein
MTSANTASTTKRKAGSTRTKKATAGKSPARKGGRTPKYDYDGLRTAFVEGFPENPDDPEGSRDWPNLRELSERTNVPYERIRERSAKERWVELRHAHQMEIAKQRRKKRVETLSTKAVEFDDRNLGIAELGLKLIGQRFTEIAKEVQLKAERRAKAEEMLRQGLPVDRYDLYSAIRSTEMNELARAADVLQNMGMKALGTDVERHSIDISGDVTVDHSISVSQELERDDPDRLAAFMAAAQRSGVFQQLAELTAPVVEGDEDETEEEGDDNVVEAEVVE